MALWACRRLIAFVVALKSWLRDEQISPSEMGRRMDMRRIRSINAAACPPLHAVHAISKIVHNNLPEDDDETEGDESAINAAIFKESTELVHVHVHVHIHVHGHLQGVYRAGACAYAVYQMGTLPPRYLALEYAHPHTSARLPSHRIGPSHRSEG